jgi:folate-binding protein YgfZ
MFINLPSRFISITGEDSEKFLQGQCSTDINSLDSNHFSYGTLNTPKGRIYGLFKVVRISNGLLLSVDESCFEHILKTLSKYAVFFKCELKEANFHSYGCSTPSLAVICERYPELAALKAPEDNSNKAGDDNTLLIRLPGKQGLLEFWSQQVPDDSCSDTEALENWLAKETKAGIPQVFSATQEQFILQELNLHELGAVSFKKGCYTGQEIIARMKFLGKLKKRMCLLEGNGTAADQLEPGADVFIKTIEGLPKKVGKLVRAHTLTDTIITALAVLNKEQVDTGETTYIGSDLDTGFIVSDLSYS